MRYPFSAVLASALVTSIAFLGEAIGQDGVPGAAPAPAPATRAETAIPIRFQGFLPGNINPGLEGKFKIEFRIYPSPQGGRPSWQETREVVVIKGQIDLELGTKTPIPMELHEATYKWLGASVNGQREIFPRYPIVNVVYASPREALLAHERWRAETQQKNSADYRTTGARPEAGAKPVAPARHEEMTWKEALNQARARGSDLADYQEWYKQLETLPPDKSADWTGHYEWVLPWVYDTASHGRYNNLFRGRFQGCDYSDLSPQKKYPFRVTELPAAPAAKESGSSKQ